MSSRLYKPKRNDSVFVGQDVLRPHAHDISVNQLLPRIAKENQIAVETIDILAYFYSKIPAGSGRQCSCFKVEVSPNSACRCCYGTGTVGGYEKWGTHLEVIDVTRPSLRAFNVIPDYGKRSRPRQFTLINGALLGHVIGRLHLKTNIGTIDHINILVDIPPGTSVSAFIKSPVDSDWVVFTDVAIKQRLTNPWIDVKIQMERPSVAAESPRFGMLFFRYNKLVNQTIRFNIPRTMKSGMLQDFGVVDEWQSQQFWTDNTLRSITTEDWIAHVDDGTRWKIIGVKDFSPQGLLLSWDLDATLIRHYQSQAFFPL